MVKVTAAVEDIRFAITDNELALKYQEANNIMDTTLNESIDSITMDSVNTTDDSVATPNPMNLVLLENSKLVIRSKYNGL